MTPSEPSSRLARRLGMGGAIAVGVGAMLGTGVFAAWTPALSFAGDRLLVALGIAAVVAALNAWSSVRLAAAHPVSGGSYAYGRRWVSRPIGIAAGISFIVGKTASAGAAALTIGAYVAPQHQRWIALFVVIAVLLIDLRGVRTSAGVTAVLSAGVIVVLMALAVLVLRGINTFGQVIVIPGQGDGPRGLLAAAALLFVAFAGYARLTVLGEEVRSPARTIPRAVAISLALVLGIYVLVGWAVLLANNSGVVLSSAPLSSIAQALGSAALQALIPIAAAVAAGTALMSLIAGVGRTLFAMADAGDAPSALARVSTNRVPVVGELVAAVMVVGVVLAGGIAGALALSAGSIGLYYAVAHLSALRMSGTEEGPPRWVPIAGLVGCAVLVTGAAFAIAG